MERREEDGWEVGGKEVERDDLGGGLTNGRGRVGRVHKGTCGAWGWVWRGAHRDVSSSSPQLVHSGSGEMYA